MKTANVVIDFTIGLVNGVMKGLVIMACIKYLWE
jgi:hypothetical protein